MASLVFAGAARSETITITAAQRDACAVDVVQFCAASMPDVAKIFVCLKGKRTELSQACRASIPAWAWKMSMADMRRLVVKLP